MENERSALWPFKFTSFLAFHSYLFLFFHFLLPFESSISPENKCYVSLHVWLYIQFAFTAITNIAEEERTIISKWHLRETLWLLFSLDAWLRIARQFWGQHVFFLSLLPSSSFLFSPFCVKRCLGFRSVAPLIVIVQSYVTDNK